MNGSRHPSLEQLALLTGGELKVWTAFLVRRHATGCARCGAELASLAASREELKDASMCLPGGLNWDRLAAEMKANIRLGLEMGEIVRSVPVSRPGGSRVRAWQISAVAASLAFVLFSSWFLSRPRDFYRQTEPAVTRVTLDGIGVAERGAAMTLLAPEAETATTSADIGAGVQARYVDANSGQVTIHHVYTE